MNFVRTSAATQRCYRCKEHKELTAFCIDKLRHNGRALQCRECRSKRHRSRRAQASAEARQRRYGVSARDYAAMMAKQDGVCAMCEQPPKQKNPVLAVDHDHETDKVRGLLCLRCNTALAYFEDEKLAARAEAYLKRAINCAAVGA
jgi:Recombination endonuclease VII